MSKLRSTEKQRHGHFLTGHFRLRGASCHWELGEGTAYVFSFPPSSVLCILSFAQTCEHPNSAGFQPRLMSDSTVGKNTKGQLASTLHYWQFNGSPNCFLVGGHLGLLVSRFLKFHTVNFPKKDSYPQSDPEL